MFQPSTRFVQIRSGVSGPRALRSAVSCASLLLREWPSHSVLARTAPPLHYMGQLGDLVAQAQECSRTRWRGPSRRPNSLGEMPCHKCGRYCPPHEFWSQTSQCRDCHRGRLLEYRSSLRGNVVVLLNSARTRSKKKGWHCSLGRNDIFNMLCTQRGRCAYSGVPMQIRFPHAHWRMSLERVDNSLGYIRENCVLVAGEFNSADHSRRSGVKLAEVQGSAQWSSEKIQFVRTAWKSTVMLERLERDIGGALGHGVGTCHSTSHLLRHRSKTLVWSAASSAKHRGHSCDIAFTDILQKLWEQKGRCFYSGVPLQYLYSHHDWTMSLERLDNNLGYTMSNCVLIAAEFNTPDHSRRAVGDVRGSSQWSLAKMMHVWGRAGFLEEQPLLLRHLCKTTPVVP